MTYRKKTKSMEYDYPNFATLSTRRKGSPRSASISMIPVTKSGALDSSRAFALDTHQGRQSHPMCRQIFEGQEQHGLAFGGAAAVRGLADSRHRDPAPDPLHGFEGGDRA